MKCIQILFGSAEYQAALELRETYLRNPLGLSQSEEDLVGEDSQWHFGTFDGSRLVACVILKPLNKTTVQLRQMVVCEDCRSKGTGSVLLSNAERFAQQNGIQEIVMATRHEIRAFYKKQGYREAGEKYPHLGIDHIEMRKSL